MNIIPDIENEGLNLFCDYTDNYEIINSFYIDFDYTNFLDEIHIIESGWLDLVGDENNLEFYMKYYIEKINRYNIIILTKRQRTVTIYNYWGNNYNTRNMIFFQRNNKPYMILDERWDSSSGSDITGIHCTLSIHEYKCNPNSSFWEFEEIYYSVLGFGGGFEFIESKIIIYQNDDGNNNTYFLNFNNSAYELIK
jgi:hypothetical protein